MPAAAEEAREEVEGVVVPLAAALFVLFETFVAVLVVDAAGLGVREGFVGFSDFDEFLVRGFVASGQVCQFGGEWEEEGGKLYGFLSGWYFLLNIRYAFLMSFSDAFRLMLRSL